MKFGSAFLILLGACASVRERPAPIKVYMHSVENRGFIRLQKAEVIPYERAPQWMAFTPEDFQALLLRCQAD